MKRPKIDPDSHYSLTEAARASKIPRGVLDHGCRSGRLPFRQTDSGVRLLSGKVVAQLAQDGDLLNFPKPYEPPPGPAPNLGYEDSPGGGRPAAVSPGPSAADRLGLLDKPSAEMVRAKESAERTRLEAEKKENLLKSTRAQIEIDDLLQQQADGKGARRQVQLGEQRAEAEGDRLARVEQARRHRLESWVKNEIDCALADAKRDWTEFLWLDTDKQNQVLMAVARQVAAQIQHRGLGPDSPRDLCSQARKAAIVRALAPYRCDRMVQKIFRRTWLGIGPIRKILDQLHADAHCNLAESERAYLERRCEPEIKAEFRSEFLRRGVMTEDEAFDYLRQLVEKRL